jgi:hypothetical protein
MRAFPVVLDGLLRESGDLATRVEGDLRELLD